MWMCVSVGERDSVCVFVVSRMLATLIHKAFRTCFRRLFLCHHLSGCQLLVHRPDSLSVSCVDQSLHTFFSTGISLLVPHGGIAEDTTWEMNMIINREDSRWGGGAVCIFGCSPLIFQSITELLPSLFLSLRLFLSFPTQTCTQIVSYRERTVTYSARIQYRCKHIPTQHGTIAHHVEATWEEDMCVTNALTAEERLHYCLKQLSRQKIMHSTPPWQYLFLSWLFEVVKIV